MPSRLRRSPVATDRRFRKKQGGSDFGPQERWQHLGRVLECTERAGILAVRATEESIVDIMVTRKALTQAQANAAFKFKLDFQRAGLAAHVTGSYSPVRANKDYCYGAKVRNDFEEAAYQRWRNAVRELGLGLSGLVISTVCHDLLPMPRDIDMLRLGLEKLIDWYGLPKEGTSG